MSLQFSHEDFNKTQVLFIYKRAVNYRKMRDQWLSHKDFANAALYEARLDACLELMENIIVFNEGVGTEPFRKGGFQRTTDQRLLLIGRIFS